MLPSACSRSASPRPSPYLEYSSALAVSAFVRLGSRRGSEVYCVRVAVDYVCELCGFAGRCHSEIEADLVQCSQCGELVVPLELGSGIVTDWPD